MNHSYKLIFAGYILIALKILNSLMFQFLGLFGYVLIGIGLYKQKSMKEYKAALIGCCGLLLISAYTLLAPTVENPQFVDILWAIGQIALYVILNWILLSYMFDGIYIKLKEKKLYDDASLSKKKKSTFMNLVLYSILCINCAFMFPSLGAIIFLLGVGLNIYLSIIQMVYFKKMSSILD